MGVSGQGIAAYKACELVRRLVRDGHEVIPIVSSSAERFVTAETFAALARRPAKEDLYPHLERADLYVIAPLTANTMAKLAHGLADNVLTEAALAHRGPLVVAPAMNDRMWSHPATQANAELLRSRGVEFVGPAEGELAEGGVGRGADGRAARDRGTASPNCSQGANRVRWPASASSSPPEERASPSTPSASSATARPGGWASRSPPRPSGEGRT